jgi:DNA-binding MarR family transcriptional regulator
MKPTWTAVLREIGRHHTTTIREVAEATRMPRPAVRNVVLALARRGLVERVVWAYDPESGYKRVAICLTPAGRRVARRRDPGQLELAA